MKDYEISYVKHDGCFDVSISDGDKTWGAGNIPFHGMMTIISTISRDFCINQQDFLDTLNNPNRKHKILVCNKKGEKAYI